jgi:hypothetical protein
VRPRDREMAETLERGLVTFSGQVRPLHGIADAANRNTLVEQLLESTHRIQFIRVLQNRSLAKNRANPESNSFDPLKAAIIQRRKGNIDEAFWLTFLFVHFGKHRKGGWRYAREVYGRLGDGGIWDWRNTSANPAAFRQWLGANQGRLRRPGSGFGNHRKYESLDAVSPTGTGAVVESYIAWVGPNRSHQTLVRDASQRVGEQPSTAFNTLYLSMSTVVRFGRTARFDYLTMLGKLALADIEPSSPYLQDSTGPLRGAKLLFASDKPTTQLDEWTTELGNHLGVGMQVMEDALCNWQKNPARFERFRG